MSWNGAGAQQIDVRAVAQRAADLWGITVGELSTPEREPQVVRARHALIWALHTATAELRAESGVQSAGLSASAIGRLLGRDHTTVLHSIGQARRLRAEQPIFRRWSDELTQLARTCRTGEVITRLVDQTDQRGLSHRIKPKNELAQGDSDARMRLHGTFALGRALQAARAAAEIKG